MEIQNEDVGLPTLEELEDEQNEVEYKALLRRITPKRVRKALEGAVDALQSVLASRGVEMHRNLDDAWAAITTVHALSDKGFLEDLGEFRPNRAEALIEKGEIEGHPVINVGDLRAALSKVPAQRYVVVGVCDDEFNVPGGLFLDAQAVYLSSTCVQINAWCDIAREAPKRCVKCQAAIDKPQLRINEPERCTSCADDWVAKTKEEA